MQAIEDIHQAGVLHLDLKPEHVFYANDGADVTLETKASSKFDAYGVGRDQDRLDIAAAMTLFEQNFPEFAQPEVATAETA